MKSILASLRIALIAALSIFVSHAAPTTEQAELIKARADLVELYRTGATEEGNGNVKELKAKIARLEYIVANASAEPALAPRLVSVNFPGGPISALIAAADKSSADGFNVVGEKADLALELPAFSIRNADPTAFAGALDVMLRQRGYTLQQNYKVMPGQAPVFTLRKLQSYELRGDQSPFQSFQLAQFLNGQSVDDIIGAIRMAWELDTNHKPDALRLKFHPPTGILLVSGPPEGISVVQSVLTQLKQFPKPGPNPAATSSPEKK